MLRDLTMDIWLRHSGFQRVFRVVPKRLATSQAEHEGIMAALRARDPERASKLALWHKGSVGDTVGQLVDDTTVSGVSEQSPGQSSPVNPSLPDSLTH